MNLRSCTFSLAITLLAARGGGAQSRPAAPGPAGTWHGTSRCLVRPSSCNDERVVYYITRAGASDSVSIDAHKLVNGKEDQMGELPCLFTPANAQVTCVMPNGTWRFTLRGDSLVGDLRLRDSTKFRDVRVARSR